MNIQTFYPVFETGQVLTSGHLNNIVDYLEPQDRLTRTRLIGIGIVCGLQPDWDGAARTLTLSRGAAVTSEGYLIAEDEVVLDRFRPYTVPIPSAPDATPEEKAKARYPFLFDGNSQRQAFELLPVEFQPAPGEPAPEALTDAFIGDKTVLLFLECNLEALKNCDINDCSDKGSEMNLTLRRLLVARSVADKILNEEQAVAGRPVDRASHPRLALLPLAIEKINPALHQVDSLAKLYGRILAAAGTTAQQLFPAMRDAWIAYRPLLADMFPDSRFPEGPIPKHHFLNMMAALAETPALIQYFHGAIHDMLRSYNEFIESAARFDAECCPDPLRFPKHVLAGDALARPAAFEKAPKTLADYAAYDPLAATGGPAPEGVPAARRHHFVPSPAVDAGNDKAAELRSLFSRMVLLAQTYATRDLLGVEIRLSPSRDGAALGERAIPFYYRFQETGDLFRNWSWRKARANLLGSIHAYRLTAAANEHPLLFRQDDQDFIRIEGIVGKPLGTAMAQLLQQRQALGLSFAVDPVWIGYGDDGRDETASALARRAMQQLLLCRMRDLDVIFLTVMGSLFAFMVWIVRVLGRLDSTRISRGIAIPGAAPTADLRLATGLSPLAGARLTGLLGLDPREEARLSGTTETVLRQLRQERAVGEDLVMRLAVESAGDKPLEPLAVANIYDRVRDSSIGGELVDRVRAVVGGLRVEGDREEIAAAVYPAVALVARAEEMMEVVSAPSIADFDEARFGTALRGFADAYETYAARAEIDLGRTTKEIADVNTAIIACRGLVGTAAAQFGNGAIGAELGKRVRTMFEEMTLQGYARKHPGVEHKAGVPVGGTFVLVYGSRSEIQAGMRSALAEFNAAFGKHFASLVEANPPAIAVDAAIEQLLSSSKPQSDDVLDEFVVLGDLCLPYLCCDGQCADAEIDRRIVRGEGVVRAATIREREIVSPAPGPTPSPAPSEDGRRQPPREATGTVEVTIARSAAAARGAAAAQSVLLTVTELSSGDETRIEFDQVTRSLQLKPGKYGFAAVSGRHRSDTVELSVTAGATEKIRLLLA